MSSWQPVAQRQDIPSGEGRTFSVDGKLIAVFRINDEFFALEDLCPHMGASLGEGYVDDGAVTCPWHAWRFCLKTGAWLDNPGARVRAETLPVRIEGEQLLVCVSSGAIEPPDAP